MKDSSNKLNIGLIGYGKMGKTIEKLAIKKNHEVVLRISSSNVLEINQNNLDYLSVAIEFSDPTAALKNLKILAENKVATICGTTGWLDHYEDVCNLFKANDTPFLYASNFSIGVNIFFDLNKRLAKMMNAFSNYDIDMMESHHIEKKDAPSGTAITLANQIIHANERKAKWTNETTSNSEDLNIISRREPEVKGFHEINYTSNIDKISISHEAFSREGFASGAITAAEWIQGKQGIFDFSDIMKDM